MLILLRKLFCSFQLTSYNKLAPQEEFGNLGEAILMVPGVKNFRQISLFKGSAGLESLEVIVGENRGAFVEIELRTTSIG